MYVATVAVRQTTDLSSLTLKSHALHVCLLIFDYLFIFFHILFQDELACLYDSAMLFHGETQNYFRTKQELHSSFVGYRAA